MNEIKECPLLSLCEYACTGVIYMYLYIDCSEGTAVVLQVSFLDFIIFRKVAQKKPRLKRMRRKRRNWGTQTLMQSTCQANVSVLLLLDILSSEQSPTLHSTALYSPIYFGNITIL